MKLKFTALLIFVLMICLTANAQSGRKSSQTDERRNQSEEKSEGKQAEKRNEDRPVNIFRRPAPDAKAAAECFRNEGYSYVKTVLRVTFDASAKITDVEILNPSGCKEFDEESVDAARRIKFEPAVKDGEPTTVTKRVVYQGGIL